MKEDLRFGGQRYVEELKQESNAINVLIQTLNSVKVKE